MKVLKQLGGFMCEVFWGDPPSMQSWYSQWQIYGQLWVGSALEAEVPITLSLSL